MYLCHNLGESLGWKTWTKINPNIYAPKDFAKWFCRKHVVTKLVTNNQQRHGSSFLCDFRIVAAGFAFWFLFFFCFFFFHGESWLNHLIRSGLISPANSSSHQLDTRHPDNRFTDVCVKRAAALLSITVLRIMSQRSGPTRHMTFCWLLDGWWE